LLAGLATSQLALLIVSPSSQPFEDWGFARWCEPGYCADVVAAGEYLKEQYDGGRILIHVHGAGTRVLFYSDRPVKELIHEGNAPLWQEALADPRPYARWVVMAGDQATLRGDEVFLRLYGSPIISDGYSKLFDRQGVAIYRRNDPPPAP